MRRFAEVSACALVFACDRAEPMRVSGTLSAIQPARAVSELPLTLRTHVGRIDLLRLLSVGLVEGPAEYAFGEIESIASRPDLGFYACDTHDAQVRSYDSAGRYLKKVGRAGSGPGEYRSCRSMMIVGDSALIVVDPENGRIVLFKLGDEGDNKVIRAPGIMSIVFADTADRLWSLLPMSAARGTGVMSVNTFRVFDLRGRVVDSIDAPALRHHPQGFRFTLWTADGFLMSATGDTVWTVTPFGEVAMAYSGRYNIVLRTFTGEREVFSKSTSALPYTRDERSEWDALRARQPMRPQAPIQPTKPLIRELFADDSRRLWIRLADTAYRARGLTPSSERRRPSLSYRERGVYDLVNLSSGEYIGRLELPIASRLLTARGDRIWIVREGLSGEDLIEIYHLQPSAPNAR